MTKYEKQMVEWGCPDCGSEIELYDTSEDGRHGSYRCQRQECGRDTQWAVGKSLTIHDVIEKIKNKETPQTTRLAFCHECPEKQVQQDLFDEKCNSIAGCNKMSRQEWNNKETLCPLNGCKRIILSS